MHVVIGNFVGKGDVMWHMECIHMYMDHDLLNDACIEILDARIIMDTQKLFSLPVNTTTRVQHHYHPFAITISCFKFIQLCTTGYIK